MKPVLAPLALAALVTGCAATTARGPGAPTSREATGDLSYQSVLASRDIDGKVVGTPSDETRATLVVFFASWCHPCRHELALLGELHTEDPELRVVGLNAYEEWSDRSDQAALRDFLAENAPWLQVVHADAELMKVFGGVPKIPTMFVFDGKGELTAEFRRDRRAPPSKAEVIEAVSRAKNPGGKQPGQLDLLQASR